MSRILMILMVFGLVACEEYISLDPKTVSEITYCFQDASVPPEYHRSYCITIYKAHGTIEVDSYGDLLVKEEFKLKGGEFESLVSIINEAQLKVCDSNNDPTCSGSTSELISIKEGQQEVYHRYIDNCNGDYNSSECGDIIGVIEAIEAFVPQLESLLR